MQAQNSITSQAMIFETPFRSGRWFYRIQPNDTAVTIARRFGVPLAWFSQMVAANPKRPRQGASPYMNFQPFPFVGEVLHVPPLWMSASKRAHVSNYMQSGRMPGQLGSGFGFEAPVALVRRMVQPYASVTLALAAAQQFSVQAIGFANQVQFLVAQASNVSSGTPQPVGVVCVSGSVWNPWLNNGQGGCAQQSPYGSSPASTPYANGNPSAMIESAIQQAEASIVAAGNAQLAANQVPSTSPSWGAAMAASAAAAVAASSARASAKKAAQWATQNGVSVSYPSNLGRLGADDSTEGSDDTADGGDDTADGGDGTTTSDQTCPAGTGYQGQNADGTPICTPLTAGQDQSCPTGQQWDPSANSGVGGCVQSDVTQPIAQNCAAGMTWDATQNACEPTVQSCGQGYVWNPTYQSQAMMDNDRSPGACVLVCPAGQMVDPQSGNCTCGPGSHWDATVGNGAGGCVVDTPAPTPAQSCPAGQHWDKTANGGAGGCVASAPVPQPIVPAPTPPPAGCQAGYTWDPLKKVCIQPAAITQTKTSTTSSSSSSTSSLSTGAKIGIVGAVALVAVSGAYAFKHRGKVATHARALRGHITRRTTTVSHR